MRKDTKLIIISVLIACPIAVLMSVLIGYTLNLSGWNLAILSFCISILNIFFWIWLGLKLFGSFSVYKRQLRAKQIDYDKVKGYFR